MNISIKVARHDDESWTATVEGRTQVFRGSTEGEATQRAQVFVLGEALMQLAAGEETEWQDIFYVQTINCIHTGTIQEYRWRSRAGGMHLESYWSCCGRSKREEECGRTRGRYHPEGLRGSGSRSRGGHGSARWACCGLPPDAPGCVEEGTEGPQDSEQEEYSDEID